MAGDISEVCGRDAIGVFRFRVKKEDVLTKSESYWLSSMNYDSLIIDS